MGRMLALWWHLVASRIALNRPCQAMCAVSHRHIAMVINITSKGGVFFAIINLLSCITLAKQSCYGKHELNTIYTTTYYHV
jgi:hypothetical protein